MKKLLFSLVFCTVSVLSFAQNCPIPQAQIDLHGNHVMARILNNGNLFTNKIDGQFLPNPDPNSAQNPSTIFAAGIWMGGVDPAGNLKLNAVTYPNSGGSAPSAFSAGPLNMDGSIEVGTCSNWDRHFKVTKAEIEAFQNALPLSAAELKAQFPSIAGWPGQENPHFFDIWGFNLPLNGQILAPFFDLDNNGLYDPLMGDYPVVQLRNTPPFVPAEIVWCVFNGQNPGSPGFSSPILAEFQLTAWAFDCDDQPELQNTVFTSYKIINRSGEALDETFFGLWADIDLGCYLDDYIGCNPSLNTMYAYNQDAVDGQPGGNCFGTPSFVGVPPVQSITILNKPLSKFNVMTNANVGSQPQATTDPTNTLEYYHYLNGRWRDGSPLTYGGNGYGGNTPTDHSFPSDPADVNGWNMCTANLPLSDQRMLGSTKIGLFSPGEIEEVIVAWAFHPNPSLPCGLGNTFNDIATLQSHYDNGFEGVCGLLLKAPELPADSLKLFPNPSAGTALLWYGSLQPLSIRAFDAAGRLVMEQIGNFDKQETRIETADWASGVYTLQILTQEGVSVKKLAVAR